MYQRIISELRDFNCQLVAVSKTKSVESIMNLYHQGQRDFGENRVQDLVQKHELLPKDIRWHMIGHLQKNKVKYIAPFIYMIHSVDSLKLLKLIDNQAVLHKRQIQVLLQIKISEEDTKFGMETSVVSSVIEDFLQNNRNTKIAGLMGMASFTDDAIQIRREFESLKSSFDYIKSQFFPGDTTFRHLSMGMSSDYQIALEVGATMVRIGSLIFGVRY